MIRIKMALIAIFLFSGFPVWAQTGCEISNVGADSGIATISATPNMGYSAPGGVGAVGFRIPVACVSGSVAFHVWRLDTSPSNAPTTYDIGLYCVSGDCANGSSGALYVHTGPIYGSWFTNSRTVKTVAGVSISGTATTLTLTGTFYLPDFPVGTKVTISSCAYGSNVTISSASATVITTNNPTALLKTISNCSVTSNTTFPSAFSSPATCVSKSMSVPCQQAFPWVADSRTVCTAIPCTLPAGLYASAIGTNCSDALQPVTCAQLLGDADRGEIYPFTATSTSYDAGGLPASMNFTISNLTPVWNTTQGPSAPIKPAKLLIY